MSEDFDLWVATYIESQDRAGSPAGEVDPLFWAVDKFFRLDDEEPDACWEAILEIVRRKPSARVLSVLAAGPLEDLIQYHGPKYIDRIEIEARTNSDFRYLLAGVWESSSPQVWARIVVARDKSW